MPTAGIRVLTVGRTFSLPHDVRHVSDMKHLMGSVAEFIPDVVVSCGVVPGALVGAAFEIRRRWIHVDANASDAEVAGAVESCYAFNLWTPHQYAKDNPLISVYTGTFNTGDFLRDAYQSLRDQTYSNWEWIVVDDGSSDRTWDRLVELAAEDHRVRPFRNARRCGKIGGVKDMATRLCKGEYLVELDHDDMLTDFALEEIRKAFAANPDVGMVYSNCSNFFQNGEFQRFNDDFWKDRYRLTEYRGKQWLECLNPDIYDRFGPDHTQQFGWFLTVGPNHVRAFRASTLRELGGYNPELPVADDWDLYARFFLRSKCLHVDKMLYLYRFLDGWSNTTFTRNKSIQDHLALGRANYAQEFSSFNEKRLGGANKVAKRDEVALTVAVSAIESRRNSTLQTLLDDLFAQAKGKPVEVVAVLDNRWKTLSDKRNSAIRDAKGRFISFVDDDDRVSPDYVDSLLEAISKDRDADCVVFDAEVHGYAAKPKICRYGAELRTSEDADRYYRKPMPICCWRRDVAARHEFRNYPNEDMEWADRAVADVKRQVRIEKTLYFYLYNPAETTQGRPARHEGTTPAAVVQAGKYGTEDVSYVILDAVGMELTEKCLKSIREHSPRSEVVLVANGAAMTPACRALADKVVDLEVNIGFAAGCNRGAMEVSRPLVCFLNNDAFFVDDTPSRLAAAVTETHPLVAPYADNAKPPQGPVPREACPKDDLFPEMVVGLCLTMPVDLFRRIGGFDPRLTTWEDDQLCKSAAALGAACKVVGGAWVRHEMHATFKLLGMDPQAVIRENGRIFARKNPKIRVVAIAKDEASCVQDFFGQFRGITKDFCLLDTGSTDNTVDLALAAGAVVESGMIEDFAQARNEALRRFAGDAEWIIMLDQDERLDSHTMEHLGETLFRTPYDILLAPLHAVEANGSRREFVAKPFCFRNRPEIRWAFKVHEKLIGSLRQATVVNARIDHVIKLHTPERRAASAAMYNRLSKEEPYFTDPAFREDVRKRWPILDYDRMDDPRIDKIHVGPLVTVVVPTHARGDLLPRAVVSAIGQDYANLEVVVVGDACPEMEGALTAFAGNPRVRTVNLPSNHGAGGAVPRNYGIMLAAGELIAYVDDDNALEPNHVSTLYSSLRLHGAAFAFSSMKVDGKDLIFDEPKLGSIDTSCVLHRKGLVRRHGWWRNRGEDGYAHDFMFFNRFVQGGERWVATRIPTLIYSAETSGQGDFLRSKLSVAAGVE